MEENGQVVDETAVRFERVLPGSIERVWNHLTDGEHLAGWLIPGTIEPRSGGEVNLANGHIRGVVTQWKPPRQVIYTWNVFSPGEVESRYPESYVMWELKPQDDAVLLTLTHRPMLNEFTAQTMMGWHTFLEMLAAILNGEQPEPRETIMERNRIRYGVSEIKRM
jgi:uncharacterized protein YndB with AHSA1/START domain